MLVIGLVYNLSSVYVTESTSSLTRTLIEELRTFIIWILQLIIFYWFSASDTLYMYREVGEEWADGSYLQLSAFLVLVFAVFQYRGYPEFSCFSYNKEEKSGIGFEPSPGDDKKQIETYLVDDEADKSLASAQHV